SFSLGLKAVRVFSEIVWWTTIALAIVGLLFRSFVWAGWPPADPNDSCGLSDIIEGLIMFGLAALCALLLLVAIVSRAQKHTKRSVAIRHAVTAIVLPMVYLYAYRHVPSFKL